MNKRPQVTCFHSVLLHFLGLIVGMFSSLLLLSLPLPSAPSLFYHLVLISDDRAYGDRPKPRYGHSANTLNRRSFIVFGGTGDQVYNDVYPFFSSSFLSFLFYKSSIYCFLVIID